MLSYINIDRSSRAWAGHGYHTQPLIDSHLPTDHCGPYEPILLTLSMHVDRYGPLHIDSHLVHMQVINACPNNQVSRSLPQYTKW